jgi:hypothetical protein
MGTRSITCVLDEQGNKIIEMYKQFDGYPEGLGKELQSFIASGTMVNGIGSATNVFNGIECFAAQLVAHFKDGPGGIYLHAPTTKYTNKEEYHDKYFAEYYYEIDSDLTLKCWDTYNNIEVDLNEIQS